MAARSHDDGPPTPQETRLDAPSPTRFSGEIVFRQAFVARTDGREREMDDVHYFISGSHWKHVNGSGNTTALYDPATNLVHYFNGQERVDASTQAGVRRIEHLSEEKIVLGRSCKGIRTHADGTSHTTFYDPTLTVDPSLYAQHRFGGWADYLAATGGALFLWEAHEESDGVLIWEAIRIDERTFDPEFWDHSRQH